MMSERWCCTLLLFCSHGEKDRQSNLKKCQNQSKLSQIWPLFDPLKVENGVNGKIVDVNLKYLSHVSIIYEQVTKQ